MTDNGTATIPAGPGFAVVGDSNLSTDVEVYVITAKGDGDTIASLILDLEKVEQLRPAGPLPDEFTVGVELTKGDCIALAQRLLQAAAQDDEHGGDTEVPFDAFEVAWCFALDGGDPMDPMFFDQNAPNELERGDSSDVDPSMAVVWTVYGHLPQGGVEAFADYWIGPKLDFETAKAYAVSLAKRLSMGVLPVDVA